MTGTPFYISAGSCKFLFPIPSMKRYWNLFILNSNQIIELFPLDSNNSWIWFSLNHKLFVLIKFKILSRSGFEACFTGDFKSFTSQFFNCSTIQNLSKIVTYSSGLIIIAFFSTLVQCYWKLYHIAKSCVQFSILYICWCIMIKKTLIAIIQT